MKAAALILALLAASASASEAKPDPCAALVELQRKQAETSRPSKAVDVALEQCRKKQDAPTKERPQGVKLWD